MTRLRLLVAVALLAPGAAAVNPADDDAGTGGDAPDLFGSGTPPRIEPGTHAGRLTAGIDVADAFSFHAEAGDRFRVSFHAAPAVATLGVRDPEGIERRSVVSDSTAVVTVTHAGSWIVTVILDAWVFPEGVAPYTFSFVREGAGTYWTTDAGWLVVEAEWDAASSFAFEVFSRQLLEDDAPNGRWASLSTFRPSPAGGLAWTSSVTRVGASSGREDVVALSAPDPGLSLGVSASAGILAATARAWEGGIRAVVWGSGPDWRAAITLAGDPPSRLAVASGDAVRLETGREAALAEAGPDGAPEHRLDFEVAGATYAVLDMTRTRGNVTDAEGGTWGTADRVLTMALPSEGAWRARIAARTPLLAAEERVILAAAAVPLLGVVPPEPTRIV